MSSTIRVMIIGSPYQMHLYQPLVQYAPPDMRLKVVPADLCYNRKISLLSKRFGMLLPTHRVIHELIHFHPDIVFTDCIAHPTFYTKAYSILRRQHTPLVAWVLGDVWTEFSTYTKIDRLYLIALTIGLKYADRILAVCEWLKKIVKAHLPDKIIRILHQRIDPRIWLVRDDSAYAFNRPAVGILQNNNILQKVEGLLWFSDVARRMKDIHFYIAGGGPYTHLVKETYSGLKNVHLVGNLHYPDGVRRFFQSTDVYVLPSGLDCFPTTILEASVCSKPTIASRIGGIPELIKEGETGWTVPNDTHDKWISIIQSVLEDTEMRRRMGENARRFVIEHFNFETQAAELASIFHGLVT